MNVSLPDDLKDYAEEQVTERSYQSTSEYVRDLIRVDRAKQQLRSMLLAGAASGSAGVADDSYFASLSARAGELVA
ncbi:MAG: type II toxin-antitoxin system ParD family antitoxin [Propionibacteriaceae bacterium]|jgi:antitoxin ParD1/3/4|nr:type II toxin-antitoxin system ParD family antitoxin [Propionibacteriaceae bacterium]